MAFRITFFKLPNPRPFNYTPIYYDPIKERVEEARARVAQQDKTSAREESLYVPGKNLRGSFQKAFDEKRRPTRSNRLVRAVVYLSIIMLFVFMIYFADGLSILFKALSRTP